MRTPASSRCGSLEPSIVSPYIGPVMAALPFSAAWGRSLEVSSDPRQGDNIHAVREGYDSPAWEVSSFIGFKEHSSAMGLREGLSFCAIIRNSTIDPDPGNPAGV